MKLWAWFIDLLHAQPVLLLFVLIATGYVIGRISIRGFSLGPIAGILFAGILLGNEGLRFTPGAQAVGFALFIFSVGYQAGPRFFRTSCTGCFGSGKRWDSCRLRQMRRASPVVSHSP